MKLKIGITLLCLLYYSQAIYSIDKNTFLSIDKVAANPAVSVKFNSKGGHQGNCIEVAIENNGFDTCFAWVEAGRRLVSEEEKQQDIFVVKNQYVMVAPRSKGKFTIFGFCCQSHDASPRAGTVFKMGYIESKDWQTLANVVNANDFEMGAIQHAVWAVSNNHPVSSIDKGKDEKNLLLLQTVANIKHIELPWYNIGYKKTNGQIFSNLPSHIYSDIKYRLPYNGEVSIVVRDKYGIIQTTLLEDVPKNEGVNMYYFDLDIAGWKDGNYTVEVVLDDNKIIEKKKFEINTQLDH